MDNTRIGLIGELEVMVELLKRGYNPAKSYLDNGVDLILDNRIKIQVKTVTKAKKDGSIKATMGKGKDKVSVAFSKYVDFVIIYQLDTEDCFIIPAEVVDFITCLSIPTNVRVKNSKYLIYKNNWDILAARG